MLDSKSQGGVQQASERAWTSEEQRVSKCSCSRRKGKYLREFESFADHGPSAVRTLYFFTPIAVHVFLVRATPPLDTRFYFRVFSLSERACWVPIAGVFLDSSLAIPITAQFKRNVYLFCSIV